MHIIIMFFVYSTLTFFAFHILKFYGFVDFGINLINETTSSIKFGDM